MYSFRDDDIHQSGVALLLEQGTAGSLIECNPVNDCITARFNSQYISAPTNHAGFEDQLQSVLEGIPEHGLPTVMRSNHNLVITQSRAERLKQWAQGRSTTLITDKSETTRTSSSVGMKVWQFN